MTQPVVVVVDDDEDLRSLLGELLETEGYRVLTADRGDQALDLMKDLADPAIVLTDLTMPDMTGLELVAAMRKSTNLRFIPVIICSGHQKQVVPGMASYIQKPIDLNLLLTTLTTQLALSAEQASARAATSR